MNVKWIENIMRSCLTCLTMLGGLCIAFILMITALTFTIYYGCIKKKPIVPQHQVQIETKVVDPIQKAFDDTEQLQARIQTYLDTWTPLSKKLESDFRRQMNLEPSVRQKLLIQFQQGTLSSEYAVNASAQVAFKIWNDWFSAQKRVFFLAQLKDKINTETSKLKALQLDRTFNGSNDDMKKLIITELNIIQKRYDATSIESLESGQSEPERLLLEKMTQDYIRTRLQIIFGSDDSRMYGTRENKKTSGKTYPKNEATSTKEGSEKKSTGSMTIQGKDAGEIKKIKIDGIDYLFCWCPPGSFVMGSPKTEMGRKENEIPHKVEFTSGFWILQTEITQEKWISIMKCNPSYRKGNLLPVETVSWQDCQIFLTRLNSVFNATAQGIRFRLPSEAEWEYACRAGSSTPFANAKTPDMLGWYYTELSSTTHTVAEKAPNAWGLYDTHGNVWEWCHDWYGSYGNTDTIDPKGPSTGVERVFRGGSWSCLAHDCRAAVRQSETPEFKHHDLGFRIVLDVIR